MRVVLVVATTGTAQIEGLSAAGATPAASVHTPAADAEILEFGHPVWSPLVPVSPTGCPSPAVITRAIRELIGFDVLVVDAGLGTRTAAPTVTVGEAPGRDIRDRVVVPRAMELVESGRRLGRTLPDPELVVGESIPGGTTTALGVLTALGEPFGVSSSRRSNPVDHKSTVVAEALDASGLDRGELAGDPLTAIETMGDPTLAAMAGIVLGRLESEEAVTLAGGTQMVAVAALLRHWGMDAPLHVATTTFVADDETADLHEAAQALRIELQVTDPAFEPGEHVAFDRYRMGEGKEGAGMGGALMLARREGVQLDAFHQRVLHCLERVAARGRP